MIATIAMVAILGLLFLGAWKAGELIGGLHHRIEQWLRDRKRTALDRLKLPRSRVVRMSSRRQSIPKGWHL